MKIDPNHHYFAQGYFLLRYIVVLFGYDMFVRPFSEVLINAQHCKEQIVLIDWKKISKEKAWQVDRLNYNPVSSQQVKLVHA